MLGKQAAGSPNGARNPFVRQRCGDWGNGATPYRCSDREPLFVDFKDNGLQIDLRRSGSGTPVTLTAPAQGLQYVGETATATFKGTQLTIVEGDGRTRTCEREGAR